MLRRNARPGSSPCRPKPPRGNVRLSPGSPDRPFLRGRSTNPRGRLPIPGGESRKILLEPFGQPKGLNLLVVAKIHVAVQAQDAPYHTCGVVMIHMRVPSPVANRSMANGTFVPLSSQECLVIFTSNAIFSLPSLLSTLLHAIAASGSIGFSWSRAACHTNPRCFPRHSTLLHQGCVVFGSRLSLFHVRQPLLSP